MDTVSKLKINPLIAPLLLLVPTFCFAVPLSITHVSDLDFGVAYRGDPAKTIAPGTFDNAENASFQLQGDPNRAYSIQLPKRTDMNAVSGNQKIRVQSFTSYPSNTGTLDASGNGMLFIGASRGAIKNNQQTGLYVGVFTITVVY